MFGRTTSKTATNILYVVIAILMHGLFWMGFYLKPALASEQVDVDGKLFSVALPNSLCERSNTIWGINYKNFLNNLGAAANGKPRILLVIANCDFTDSANSDGLPTTWGYIAFDESVGRYWFGQKSLNKRMKREVEKLKLQQNNSVNLRDITNSSLKKIQSTLSIGDIVQVGETISDQEGFLVSAVALIGSRKAPLDVYLSTVTFIRNRQIVTFAIYKRASNKSNLDQVRSIAETFLDSLSYD